VTAGQVLEELSLTGSSFRQRWLEAIKRPTTDLNAVLGAMPWMREVTPEQFSLISDNRHSGRTRPDLPPPLCHDTVHTLATEFHQKAGSLTHAVRANLDALVCRPGIRMAHQPNLLPSLNVAFQSSLAHSVVSRFADKCPELFYVVNYDVATDRRYRHAVLPTPSAMAGYVSLSLRGPALHRETPMYAEERPTKEALKVLCERIRNVALSDISRARRTSARSAGTEFTTWPMNSVDTDERIAELVTELQWCREQSQTLESIHQQTPSTAHNFRRCQASAARAGTSRTLLMEYCKRNRKGGLLCGPVARRRRRAGDARTIQEFSEGTVLVLLR
jgi:hypothetical protein